jgi:hypothetical protein
MAAQSQAAVQGIRAAADAAALRVQAEAGGVYAGNPALLRVRELEALSQLSANPAARIHRLRQAPRPAAASWRLSRAMTRPADSAPGAPTAAPKRHHPRSVISAIQPERPERPVWSGRDGPPKT